MKPLIRVILIIAAFFAVTFVLMNSTGLLSLDQIESWLQQAKEISPLFVGSLVALLLFADLFIAVPTLTITLLSGYFLGHTYGAVSALIGVTLAGVSGYTISRYYGKFMLGYLVPDDDKRLEVINTFKRHGFVMILLSRAVPILPEVSALFVRYGTNAIWTFFSGVVDQFHTLYCDRSLRGIHKFFSEPKARSICGYRFNAITLGTLAAVSQYKNTS